MSANYKKIGEIVELIDERNKSLESSEVLGISIDKEFMPSVANTIGTDLSNYKLLRMNTFACNPMHVGRDERLPVSLYKKDIPAIVSPAYFMFRVKDENKVMPDFLMLIFKRDDFDRNCWFRTDGSVRGGITWNDICEIELPVPDLKEQEKIVNTYNAITKRIQLKQKINENLEKTAQCLFDEMFPDIIDNGKNCFGDIIEFSNGKSRPDELGSIPIYGGNGIMSYTNKTNAENCIAIGRVGAYCGSTYLCKAQCWISDNAIKAKYKFSDKQFFAYYLLKKSNLFERHIGTGQQLLTQGILSNIILTIPNEEKISKFNKLCEPIKKNIDLAQKEITILQKLKQLIISRISGICI
jgi:type I restriction enzyme S subunit